MRPTGLLISAYDAASHAAWAAGVKHASSDYDWQHITMPPRYFSWRIRGSGLSLLQARYRPALLSAPDVLLTTSMLDLATARALVPSLRYCPAVVYFHENQFAYPSARVDQNDVQLLTLKTALAADQVVFNSDWNRTSFVEGATALLNKMPDGVAPELLNLVVQKSHILPVPLDDDLFAPAPSRAAGRRLRMVWNHRWEHDKGGDRLLAALRNLRRLGCAFELHLCGQQFRQRPDCFATIEREFSSELLTFGYIPARADYLRLLREADVVVSTALHEFQGLAVMEAVACGCIPVVPARLAYPEWFPKAFCYPSNIAEPAEEAAALAAILQQLHTLKCAAGLPRPPRLEHFAWAHLRSSYNALLDAARRGVLCAEA